MLAPAAVKLVVVELFEIDKVGGTIASDVDALLFEALPSLPAPVVPATVVVPDAVGVPVTVQTIDAPGATETGGVGAHDVTSPAGNGPTKHVAPVALNVDALEFVQEKVPL